MRRPYTPLLLLLIGCGLLRFEVDHQAATEIPGGGLVGQLLDTLSFTGLNEFDTTIEDEIADQGVEPGDVRSVRLTLFRLSSDSDLSFIDSMEVFVAAPDVDELRVASGDDFPEGVTEVDLDLDDVDLADALAAGALSFRVEVDGAAPAEDTRIDVLLSAEIEATARGACRAAKR